MFAGVKARPQFSPDDRRHTPVAGIPLMFSQSAPSRRDISSNIPRDIVSEKREILTMSIYIYIFARTYVSLIYSNNNKHARLFDTPYEHTLRGLPSKWRFIIRMRLDSLRSTQILAFLLTGLGNRVRMHRAEAIANVERATVGVR